MVGDLFVVDDPLAGFDRPTVQRVAGDRLVRAKGDAFDARWQAVHLVAAQMAGVCTRVGDQLVALV